MRRLTDILRGEEGASAIEYALVACLIAVAAYAAFVHMGDRITTMYVNVSSSMPSN
jgi:pilus assembly protein Flp/PilA